MMQQTIELALKDRAPRLHAELKAAGKLTVHVAELEAQISDQVATAVMEQRAAKKWDRLPPMELAAKMKAAAALARESALAETLQFPPDETSSPSQAATTA